MPTTADPAQARGFVPPLAVPQYAVTVNTEPVAVKPPWSTAEPDVISVAGAFVRENGDRPPIRLTTSEALIERLKIVRSSIHPLKYSFAILRASGVLTP